jgi:hypothetical protein
MSKHVVQANFYNALYNSWRLFRMFYADANDPYRQQGIPYQPYSGQNAQMMPQQNNMAASSSRNRAIPTYPAAARPKQTRPVTPRKSRNETLAFVHECKKWLVAGSIVTFGLLGGLVAGHAVGTTSNQATPANNSPSTSPSTSGGNGGFFKQQPGQQQQQGGGGYGFGNNNPSQPPVSGSHSS